MQRRTSWLLLCLLMLGASVVQAQAPDLKAPVKEAMSRLSVMQGIWKGTGWVLEPGSGEKQTSSVTERFDWKLDDTIVTIEGNGKDKDGNVVHNAFGVISYDPVKREYRMASHLANGMQTLASFEVVRANEAYRWWFEDGRGGTIRYSIEIDDGTWNEVGAYSRDGENWQQFFEMNLKKE